MRLYSLFIFILITGCTISEDDLCGTYINDYPIRYTSETGFKGCLMANTDGTMVLVMKDSIHPEIHPMNGSYSPPFEIEKRDGNFIYYFNPVHNRKIFTITGKKGFPKDTCELKINDEWIPFTHREDMLSANKSITFLQPQWHLSADKMNGSNSYEYIISGINIILYSYLRYDSLFMKLKVVNHGNGLLHIFPPVEIKSDNILLSNQMKVLKKGERLNEKFAFPYSGKPPVYIEKGMFRIKKGTNFQNLFIKPIKLKIDTTEVL